MYHITIVRVFDLFDQPILYSVDMPFFSHLVRFECEEDGADLGPHADGPPSPGTKLDAVESLDELANKEGKRAVTVSRVSDI